MTAADSLTEILTRIEAIDPSRRGDDDAPDAQARYDARRGLVWQALGLAAQLGLPCGVRFDPNQPEWPVEVHIVLPTGQVTWHQPAHGVPWDGHNGAEKSARIEAYAAAEQPEQVCPRCGSPRWVSASLDGGWTRRAQCVPCGAYHHGTIGPGWKSPSFHDQPPTGFITTSDAPGGSR